MSAFTDALCAVYDLEHPHRDNEARVSREDVIEYIDAHSVESPPRHPTTALHWDLIRTFGESEGRKLLLHASRQWDATPLRPRDLVRTLPQWWDDDYEPQAWVDEYLAEVIADWRAEKERKAASRLQQQDTLRNAAQAEWKSFGGVATQQQMDEWQKKYAGLYVPFSERLDPVTIVPFPAPASGSSALPLTYFGDCREAKPARYFVKGLLAEGATSSLYGQPKTLKSTLAVDIGVHVAAGRDWRGHRVKERRGVVYFAFERSAQVRKALSGYAVRDGFAELPFAVAGRLLDMLDARCVDLVVATIRAAESRFGIPVGLAVFDTWNKGIAAGGGSEDKAEHQNLAAANLRRIIEALPSIHCMTIGHTGKDTTKGERGSNATMGDRDVGILIEGTDRVRKAGIAYANDLADGDLTAFEGEQIIVGMDDDGEPVTAFIVSQRAVTMALAPKTTTRQDLALRALRRAIESHGKEQPDRSDLPQLKMVSTEQWKDELFRAGVLKRDAKNPREPFRRLRHELLAANQICERDGFVWPAQPGGVILPPLPR